MIELSRYSHLDKINEIVSLVKPRVAEWRNFVPHLSTDTSKDQPGTMTAWYYLYVKDNIAKYKTDKLEESVVDFNHSLNGAEWLQMTLLPSIHLTIDPYVQKTFGDAIDLIKTLPGIVETDFHLMSHNVIVHPHIHGRNPGTPGRYNILINLKTPSNDNFEFVVDNKTYKFEEGEIVCFDAELTHSAKNLSGEDWLLLVLGFNSKYFEPNVV
jgi:hypothetical protein